MDTSTPSASQGVLTQPNLPWLRLVLHLLALMLVAALAQAVWLSLPAFRELFASFGAELPALTRLVLEHASGIWIGLCANLLHQAIWLLLWLAKRERWLHIGLLLVGLLNWLLPALLVIALYLPILTLGASI